MDPLFDEDWFKKSSINESGEIIKSQHKIEFLGDEDYGFSLDAADGLVLTGAPKVDLEDFNFFNFPTDSGYISLDDKFGNQQSFSFNPNDLADMDFDQFGLFS